jgi:hypothetical protein
MPTPMGHTAMGLAAYELYIANGSRLSHFTTFFIIAKLANLPDVDIIIEVRASFRGFSRSSYFLFRNGKIKSKSRSRSFKVGKKQMFPSK